MLALARGNAASGVGHCEDGAVVLVFCTFDHDTALFGELDGIVDEAEQYAHNAFPLSENSFHATDIAEQHLYVIIWFCAFRLYFFKYIINKLLFDVM